MKEKVAKELLKMAKNLVAFSEENVNEVIKPIWNDLHDLEYQLEAIAHKYDVAASYVGKPGEKEAKKVLKQINEVVKIIKTVTMKEFGELSKMDSVFVKKFGNPDDYSEKMRKEIFPR